MKGCAIWVIELGGEKLLRQPKKLRLIHIKLIGWLGYTRFTVFKEINGRWNYVNDPKDGDYIATASESLDYFSGDCDDHSILMAAAIRSIGGTPRLIHTKGHIYPEILIGSMIDLEKINYLIKNVLFVKESYGKKIHYHIDERGQVWMNLDYTATYPGGPFMYEEILGALTLN